MEMEPVDLMNLLVTSFFNLHFQNRSIMIFIPLCTERLMYDVILLTFISSSQGIRCPRSFLLSPHLNCKFSERKELKSKREPPCQPRLEARRETRAEQSSQLVDENMKY